MNKAKRVKGVMLYSGGLDSLLAAKILIDQKIDLIGLNFLLPFIPLDFDTGKLKSSRYAEQIGLPLRYLRCDEKYMKIIENPPHGYGKLMNPCIDCKIFFLKKAKEVMEEENASFVATGEVVGQRPMSQMKHTLNHIEKESGLKGHLLRPLSAKLLRPTEAEECGIIDREKLSAINGRSRKIQMRLASEYKITEYSSPAGGCLLTDKNIAKRLKDLFENHPEYSMTDVYLVTVGRHYRIHKNAKIIVSRNERENIILDKYRDEAEYFLEPHFRGPMTFVRGALTDDYLNQIGSIVRRYGTLDKGDWAIKVDKKGSNSMTITPSKEAADELLDKLRI